MKITKTEIGGRMIKEYHQKIGSINIMMRYNDCVRQECCFDIAMGKPGWDGNEGMASGVGGKTKAKVAKEMIDQFKEFVYEDSEFATLKPAVAKALRTYVYKVWDNYVADSIITKKKSK